MCSGERSEYGGQVEGGGFTFEHAVSDDHQPVAGPQADLTGAGLGSGSGEHAQGEVTR
jgi:hypothetical protein